MFSLTHFTGPFVGFRDLTYEMVYAVCGVSAFLRSLCRGVVALPFAGGMAVYRRTLECYDVLIKYVLS